MFGTAIILVKIVKRQWPWPIIDVFDGLFDIVILFDDKQWPEQLFLTDQHVLGGVDDQRWCDLARAIEVLTGWIQLDDFGTEFASVVEIALSGCIVCH